MGRKRVQQMLNKLKCFKRMNNSERKKYVKKCDKSVIHCICECVRNLLKGQLPVKSSHLDGLSRYKQSLRNLSHKKLSLVKRRNILQKGGFLYTLMPSLLSGLSTIVGNLITNYNATKPKFYSDGSN